MAEWIEVPAHRILQLSDEEYRAGFLAIGEDGEPAKQFIIPYRIVRKSDNKLFKAPRYHIHIEDLGRQVFLEEV